MKKQAYIRPLLQVVTVTVELGFGGSGSNEDDTGQEEGAVTPDYEYEDDEWD